ncbi:MAG: hypothetical protein WA728_26910, partial [Xanthobacteraceae bacterium]
SSIFDIGSYSSIECNPILDGCRFIRCCARAGFDSRLAKDLIFARLDRLVLGSSLNPLPVLVSGHGST